MTTHRSLNKLEFKAHMSIHNMTEVSPEHVPGMNWTRDRFGKQHGVSESDGSSRLWRPSPLAVCAALLIALSVPAIAHARNTDVQVESENFKKRVLDIEPELEDDPLTFYKEGDTSVILNDDVQPQMNVEF